MTIEQAVFGIVGKSGSGKTTLIEAMVAYYAQAGLDVAVIKHSHHVLQFEPPHKDSARFRHAGAREVIIASPHQYAIFHTPTQPQDPDPKALLARLGTVDLVLIEGYRHMAIPRIEVHRPSTGTAPLYPELDGVVAVASDAPDLPTLLPILDVNQPELVAKFVIQYVGLGGGVPT